MGVVQLIPLNIIINLVVVFMSFTFLVRQDAMQGFGSGSGLDPDSIGPVDPDPDSESGSGSGSRRAKMTHKSRKNW